MNARDEPTGATGSAAERRRTPPPPSHATPSGIEVPTVVTPDMCAGSAVGRPGQPPFTRSIFADGYRGRLWTFRQYSGFGSAEETNARYRFLLEQRLDRSLGGTRSAHPMRLRSR